MAPVAVAKEKDDTATSSSSLHNNNYNNNYSINERPKNDRMDRPIAINNGPLSQSTEDDTSTILSFYTTKWAILRLLALVYWVAFCGAINQNRGLMGSQGLQPAAVSWMRLQERVVGASSSSAWNGFLQQPTLFWWIPLNDTTMDGVAMVGLLLASLAVSGLYVSWASLLTLWLTQCSMLTMASHTAFYQYGWESQLLETGFLAIFLCDLPSISFRKSIIFPLRLNLALAPSSSLLLHQHPPSKIVLWLFRWLCFRISMGAGLIKIRGSSCWTEKTCLWYHFETQPIPSPLSFIFHFLPRPILSAAVDLDLFVQLYTSWMVLLIIPPPAIMGTTVRNWLRTMVRAAGLIQAGFMVNIMLSGNFSFLNHLTVIPALACLDDACWPVWMQTWVVPNVAASSDKTREPTPCVLIPALAKEPCRFPPRWMVNASLLTVIGCLSWPVVLNLLQFNSSGRQMMNASFDRFHLVNTYGAFGDVGRARYEPIVSVSTDGNTWNELEFPCKPGSLTRRPCFCAPYHYRLDWNIWFLGFPPHTPYLQNRETWLYSLLEKVLDPSIQADDTDTNTDSSNNNGNEHRPWLNLLDASSAQYLKEEKEVLRFAKVDMYHYRMAAPLSTILVQYWERWSSDDSAVTWWKRSYHTPLVQPVRWKSGGGLLLVD